MGSLILSLLLGLQVNHTMYAQELLENFAYRIRENIEHPYLNGDTQICFFLPISFNKEPDVRACVPSICTTGYSNIYVSNTEYEKLPSYICLWFWKHQLKSMKLFFEILIGDDWITVKE